MTRKPITTGRRTLVAMLGVAAAGAFAQENWDARTVADDWQATAVLGGEVVSLAGREVGDVHDLIIGNDGLVSHVLVERNKAAFATDPEYVRIPWEDVVFEPAERQVTLVEDTLELGDYRHWPQPPDSARPHYSATRLIGLPVHREGIEPFGEIDDILIEAGAAAVSAFVVEPDEVDEDPFALPWAAMSELLGDRDLWLPYGEMEIEALDPFVPRRPPRQRR